MMLATMRSARRCCSELDLGASISERASVECVDVSVLLDAAARGAPDATTLHRFE